MADSPYGFNYYFSGSYPLSNLPQLVIDLLVGGNGEDGLVPGGPVWFRPGIQAKDLITTNATIVNGLPTYPATDTYDWGVVDDLVTRCNAVNILVDFALFGFPDWRKTIDINGKTVPFDGQTCKATLATAITVTGVNTPTITINALPTGHTISDQQQITVDYNGANPEDVIAQGSYAAGATTITVLNTAGNTWKPKKTHAAGCDVWNSGAHFPNPVDTKNYIKAFISRYNGTATNYVTGGAQNVLTVDAIQPNEDWDTPGSNAQRDVQSKWFVPVWQLVGPMVRTHAPNMKMWGPAARRTASDGSDPIYGLQHIDAWTGNLFTYTPPGSSTAGVMPYLDEFDGHYYRGGVGNPDPAVPLPGPVSGAAVPTLAQEATGILGVIATNAATATGVVITETGWDVYDDGTGGTHTVSQQQQADFICGPNNAGNLTGYDGVYEQLRKAGATHAFIYVINPNSVAKTWTDATHPLPSATETKDIVQNIQSVKGGPTVFTKLPAYNAIKAYIAATPTWATTPPPPPPPPTNAQGDDMFIPANAQELADLLQLIAQSTTTPDVADRWARQLGQIDLARVLGGTLSAANPLFAAQSLGGLVLSATNPEPNISNIQQFILNGQGYSATTGKLTAAAATQAFSLFNPVAANKNVLLYSLKISYSNANVTHDIRLVTADPAFANACTINNSKIGGPTTAGITSTYSTTTQTPGGTLFDAPESGGNVATEVFSNGNFLLLPAGVANGLAVYLANTATGTMSVTAKWIEY